MSATPNPGHERPSGELLDHEYDGIQEYDNPLPGWWKQIFWATFFFSLGYFFYYHLSHRGTSVEQDYVDEMRAHAAVEAARAQAAGVVTEEALLTASREAKNIDEGKKTFATLCAVCHASDGRGLIGPNLTDAYWVNGAGTLMDIYRVIDSGSLAKGMPAWGKQLGPDKMREVTTFLGTLRNTNVANGKAPEGNAVAGVAPGPAPGPQP